MVLKIARESLSVDVRISPYLERAREKVAEIVFIEERKMKAD